MRPDSHARRMPAQSREHSRTDAAKNASKARRNARRAKHTQRTA